MRNLKSGQSEQIKSSNANVVRKIVYSKPEQQIVNFIFANVPEPEPTRDNVLLSPNHRSKDFKALIRRKIKLISMFVDQIDLVRAENLVCIPTRNERSAKKKEACDFKFA